MIVELCPKIEKNAFPAAESPVESGKKMRAMPCGIVNGKQLTDDEEAFSEGALSSQHSVVSEKQNQHQHQRLFTAKDTEDAKEEKGLPLMNADDTDFGEACGKDGRGDVEFVAVPGGYGFERVRLRIKPSDIG